MIKLYFRSNSPSITYLFLFFTGEQIFKSSKWGRLRDSVAGRPRNTNNWRFYKRPGDVT